MSSPLILIVDDDSHIRDVVRFALTREGMRTVEASNGLEALQRVRQASGDDEQPTLIVLDILMPELDGLEVCRRLRPNYAIPIVFLSSRDEELDRIIGLELGGDDYVTKPFSPRELVARVKAVLRRGGGGPEGHPASGPQKVVTGGIPGAAAEPLRVAEVPPETVPKSERVLRHHKLELDLDRCVARWSGQEVVLTATELGVLKTLLRYPGKVFSRDALMDQVYSGDVVVSDRTIDSHIRRVRRKFVEVGGDPITTLHGMGYRLSDCQ